MNRSSDPSSSGARRQTVLAALILVAVAACGPLAPDGKEIATPSLVQSVAVPSYFYPGRLWTRLETGAPTVGLAIINPSSGPSDVLDPNYVNQVNSTKATGITVLGYVHTNYASKSRADVEAEVDRYDDWYGVDGIFFDDVTDDCATVGYYRDLHDYVKAKASGATVVLNPGTNTGECFMTAGDILVTFEDSYDAYQGWQPSGWETKYPANRFWHLILNTSRTNLPSAIAKSKSHNIGWILVTDDSGANPWDSLPSYWSQELSLAGG
jgi:hypothetical protein